MRFPTALLAAALTLSCTTKSPPKTQAKIPLGRPAPGVEIRECLSSSKNNRCKDQGVEACEDSCGEGDMQSCLTLARLYERGAPRKNYKFDDNPEPFEKNTQRALELRRLACKNGYLEGCLALAEAHSKDPVAQEALAPLKTACDKDPACGCAMYVSAHSHIHRGKKDNETLALLDRSCELGALLACDELILMIELCRADLQSSAACALLKAQHRVPPPEPEWEKTALIAPVQGCFRVTRDISPDSVVDICPNSLGWADENRWKGSSAQASSPSSCPPPEIALGTLYCFEADRFFVQSAQPNPKLWDQEGIGWQRLGESLEFRGFQEQSPERSWMHLKLDQGHGQSILMNWLGHSLELTRLQGDEERRIQLEIQALPRADVLCERARRCETEVDRLLAPPPGPDSVEGHTIEPRRNLLGCRAAQRDAVLRLQKNKGISVLIPEDCR